MLTNDGDIGVMWFDGQWESTWTRELGQSVEQIVGLLVETASKGGNLLLNVGPTAEGLIPEESVTRLQDVGRRAVSRHANARA